MWDSVESTTWSCILLCTWTCLQVSYIFRWHCANSWTQYLFAVLVARVTNHITVSKRAVKVCWFSQVWLYTFRFWTSHKSSCLCLFVWPLCATNLAYDITSHFRFVEMAQLKVVGHAQWECIAVLLLWKCTTKMLTYRIPWVWVIHDTCINSAAWNAAIRACNSLAPAWLILLRQLLQLHQQTFFKAMLLCILAASIAAGMQQACNLCSLSLSGNTLMLVGNVFPDAEVATHDYVKP